MKVINNYILVKEEEVNKTLAGGLVIPKDDADQTRRGKVIEVGDGIKDEPMKVSVGDVVIYGKYAGTEVEIDEENYKVLKQSDVLVII